jgi:predicted phosphohydrolase
MLYTIGDLHLSFGSDKPMDVFGPAWEDHAEKLKKGFEGVNDDDTVVLCGDLTWGSDMDSCLEDFRFIESLPGKKYILKGNHDFWWNTAAKVQRFFDENGVKSCSILHNNCYFYGDTALCGTKGWLLGPKSTEHDKKIAAREVGRLETSLRAAGDAPEKIVFLHYPPIFAGSIFREIIDLMEAYGVKRCYYGHVHGRGIPLAYTGTAGGITYNIVSADAVNFTPVKIM